MMFRSAKVEVQPATQARLSKPRLVKVRRQFPSSRVRPGEDEHPDLGNNLPPRPEESRFSYGHDYTDSSNRDFVAAPQNGSSSAGSKDFYSGADFFVFGRNSYQSEVPDRCKYEENNEKLSEELRRLNVNFSGAPEKAHKLNSTENTPDSIRSFSFRGNSREGSNSDVNSADRSYEEKLQNYLSQLDINDPANWNANLKFSAANSRSGMFEFQASKTHANDKENLDSVLPEEMWKLKIEVPEKDSRLHRTEGSNSNSFSFVFGSKNGTGRPEMKAGKIKDNDKKANGRSHESTNRKLEQEIQRLKIKDPKNDDCVRKPTRDFIFSSKSASPTFQKDHLSESSVFEFGGLPDKIGLGPQEIKGGNPSEKINADEKGYEEFYENANRKLDQQIQKSKIKDPKNGDSVRNPSTDFIFSSSNCSSAPTQKDNLSESSVFGFVALSGKNPILQPRSNDGFNETAAQKLPEEIQKLKINKDTAGKTSFVFTSKSASSPKDPFVFGSKVKGSDPDSGESGVSSKLSASFSSSKTEGSGYVSARSSFTSEGEKSFSSQTSENYASSGFAFGSPTQKSKLHETPFGEDTFQGFETDQHDPVIDYSTPSFNNDAKLGKPAFNGSAKPIFGYNEWGSQEDPMSFTPKTHKGARKRRGKSKESTPSSQKSQGAYMQEKFSQGNPEMDYSPMDFSPCNIKDPDFEEDSEESVKSCSAPFVTDLNKESSEEGFTFSTSSSTCKFTPRRKIKPNSGRNKFPVSEINSQPLQNLGEVSGLNGKNPQTDPEFRCRDPFSSFASSNAAQEACEKWRLRGNQAYGSGDLIKAEEYYTLGVESVSPDESSTECLEALMICYSNRAAARMSSGRIREALSDCKAATGINGDFLRAQLRAASCHQQLGETEEACNHFNMCLQVGCLGRSSCDEKFVLQASDGLQKVKQLSDCMDKASSLLQKGTSNDAENVLQMTSVALSLSPYSETLIKMKAEALLMLRRYEELIQLLDQTLEPAKRNCPEGDNVKMWRVYLKSRAYFYLGNLEEAAALLKDYEHEKTAIERDKSGLWELLSSTVDELLRLKVAGNTAFKSGKHSDAVEHYTAALNYNIESRPFTAVCFCNRAAAYQALGQITEAISDCSLAIALDPNYRKAISRRATLHETIRDYSQATSDLRRLINLLEKNKVDKNVRDDLALARSRISKMEDKSKKEIPLDMYKILGVESSSDEVAIKKAYRKTALRHHPDKAFQLLVRSENADDKLWKEVADEVHRDADKLFKMIGEAYAILSDPSKRREYDLLEELRSVKERSHVSRGGPGESQYYSGHGGYDGKEWYEGWHRRYDRKEFSRSYRTGSYY